MLLDPSTAWRLHLRPGMDLREALLAWALDAGHQAVFVLAGFGSLRPVALRLAGAEVATGYAELLPRPRRG